MARFGFRRLVFLAVPASMLAANLSHATEWAEAMPQAIQGTWTVDLSTDPAQPYVKPMVLQLRADGTVTGSFYESEILAGRWKTDRGRTCVSFRTTDGAGPYHTAACLTGDGVSGQTWAEHRNFLFNWDAVRAESKP